jgi:hypothetical protein
MELEARDSVVQAIQDVVKAADQKDASKPKLK